jgi:putative ABC transport system permease protein
MLSELAHLAVHNLLRARARLVMTVGGVVVGTTAVILLIALTIGLQRAAEAGFGESSALTEIQVYPGFGRDGSDTSPPLDNDAIAALSQIDGVAAVIPFLDLASWGQIQSGDYFGGGQTLGVDPRYLPYLGATVSQGELAIGRNQAVAGGVVAENFYDPQAEEYQPITVDLLNSPLVMTVYNRDGTSTRDIDLQINGILAPGTSYDYALFLPIQDVIDLNEWVMGEPADPDTFVYSQILVRATSRETAGPVSEAIRALGFNAGGMGDFLNQINGFFSTMRLVLGGVGGVALLVAAFGVANTMTMAILERTREIGLMKAVGATDRDVLTIFLIEAALVGLLGGLTGLGISYVIQNLINQAVRNLPQGEGGGGITFLPVDVSQIGGNLVVIPTDLALFALALATLVGVSAGLFPALRAARMTTVLALKSE